MDTMTAAMAVALRAKVILNMARFVPEYSMMSPSSISVFASGMSMGPLPVSPGTTRTRERKRQRMPRNPTLPTTPHTDIPAKVSRLKGSPGMPVL